MTVSYQIICKIVKSVCHVSKNDHIPNLNEITTGDFVLSSVP